jgi:hypothetical protein
MSDDKKVRLTLTDEDMITSPRLSRRTLLAGVGVALGTVALAGRSAMAHDSEEKDKAEADKGDAEDDKDQGEAADDKDKGDAEDDKDKGDAEDKDKGDVEDKDKADAEADKGEAERDAD